MKSLATLLVLALWHQCIAFSSSTSQFSTTNSIVVSSTEPSKETVNEREISTDVEPSRPNVYEMYVRTNVSNRFATTLVTSKVKNWAHSAQEATFSVILPETAYISGFVMEIDGKSYSAYVKEKEEAQHIYNQAVESGQTAAHVASSARDSNRFTVSVNVEPQSKATFKLTYDELLQRQNDQYEIVLNIHPGQPVKVLDVQVNINESRPLKFVKTPSLRTGNEVGKNEEKLYPFADITITNQTAVIRFSPDEDKQKKFATDLGTKEDEGLAGQFAVQYDVERETDGGQVLIKDGYFVHFFAPSDLEPLPKYVVFVLDTSGSMDGMRIQQLKEAMTTILGELKAEDLFSIAEFNSGTKVWNIEAGVVAYQDRIGYGYPHSWRSTNTHRNNNINTTLPQAWKAHEDNIYKAKQVVDKLHAYGGTNIQSALEVALRLIENTKRDSNSTHQAMVIFLTDGEPTVGQTNKDHIISKITGLNTGITKSPIFSLSFGDGADRNFLQRISLKNLGFSRHIYEAADASLQLQEFYTQISSPLLSGVSFEYTSEAENLTKTTFPLFFRGSEIVVSGTIQPHQETGSALPKIIAHGYAGQIKLTPKTESTEESLEKIWAYLTVKQLLEERDVVENKTAYTKRALDIALKYSFVTPVSSLVVVKPNDTKAVDTENASKAKLLMSARHFPRWGSQPTYAHSGNHRHLSPSLGGGQPPPYSASINHHYSSPSFSAGGGQRPPYSASIGHHYPSPSFSAGPRASMSSSGTRGSVSRRIIAQPYAAYGSSVGFHPPPSRTSVAEPSLRLSYTHEGPTATEAYFANTTGTGTIGDKYAAIKSQLPWLKNILQENGTVTLPTGSYKLGLNETVATHPQCPRTPGPNGTTGICQLLPECPQVFTLLTDAAEFGKFFCPLDKYAGICCPLA